MTKGQEQIAAALDSIKSAASTLTPDSDVGERLDSLKADLETLTEATFVKSALSVPFTAACDRAAKSLAGSAVGSGEIESKLVDLEKAVKNVKSKSSGAGGVIIT